ncbi:MAG TPA: VOC family protein [Steroidobacteraceae bacterium]|nr:VOC family protein [Steroidobacteraceae bacterium]
MKISSKIAPCLWFAGEAEEAARFYVGIFPDSKIVKIAKYGKAGFEAHQQKEGTVLTVQFELAGQTFTALNGGPIFKFTEAVSLQIYVEDQKELDFYWDKLTAGGDPKAQVCGWLKDKYGLSWQVVPAKMVDWFGEPNEKSERAMAAMMKMGKLDIATLQRAYDGK